MDDNRPFYFIVSFWGREYREHFLRLCASSLLAPGNLPALSGSRSSRFLICTTNEDWACIQSDPIVRLLEASTVLEFIELRRSVPEFLKPVYQERLRRTGSNGGFSGESPDGATVTPDEVASSESFGALRAIGKEIGTELTIHHHYALRILFMSAGHKAAACRAHADGAYAVFLAPDMVLSDGSVAHLDRLARGGDKVVLVAACRFAQDECLAEFRKRGMIEPGKPLILPSRLLVEISFANMHPETACFEFDSPYFCDMASSAFWRVGRDRGVLLHSFFWAPLLVSYGDVQDHHAAYFDGGGTTDGKYISMHFDPACDITAVQDSDEIFLASFTRSSEYYYPIHNSLVKQVPGLRDRYKTRLIRRALYGPRGDAIKRQLYTLPVRCHSDAISPDWKDVEHRAALIVNRAVKKPGWLEQMINFGVELKNQRLKALCWHVLTYPISKLPRYRREQLKALLRRPS
jgi:hypothetical protein